MKSSALGAACGLALLAMLIMPDHLSAAGPHVTTPKVRKGNQQTTLTVDGWISMAVMMWDDRIDTGTAIVDNGEQNSRFRFSGTTRLNEAIRAGFKLEFGLSGNFAGAGGIPSSNCIDQVRTGCGPIRPIIRTEEIWIEHRRFGRASIGFASPPSRLVKNFAGRIAGAHFWGMDSSPQVGMNLLVRTSGTNGGQLRWRHLIDGRVGPFREQVAWTSPSFAGLTVSFGAGTDDHWDAALYFKRPDVAGFKIFGALAYLEDRTPAAGLEFTEVKGSVGAMHNDTGLFAWFASASRNFYEIDTVQRAGGMDWYVQAGLKRRLLAIGPTALAFDYGSHADIRAGLPVPGTRTFVQTSGAQFYGIGVTQWVAAAAAELYAGWRHYQAQPLTTGNGDVLTVHDLDVVIAGMRMRF